MGKLFDRFREKATSVTSYGFTRSLRKIAMEDFAAVDPDHLKMHKVALAVSPDYKRAFDAYADSMKASNGNLTPDTLKAELLLMNIAVVEVVKAGRLITKDPGLQSPRL